MKGNEQREIWTEGLTEASVLGEELCELVTVVLLVAAVATVTVGRDADFGGTQVVGCHHSACRGWMEGLFIRFISLPIFVGTTNSALTDTTNGILGPLIMLFSL